jgi:hypothetical protein
MVMAIVTIVMVLIALALYLILQYHPSALEEMRLHFPDL